MRRILVFVLVSGFLFSACRFKVERPAFMAEPEPDQPVSTIVVPVNSSFTSLSRMIRDEIQNPLAKGKTPEIDIKLLATESITTEELVRELVKPFTPGYYKTIWKEGTRKIKKGFSCLINPLKWGTCYKDIIETFTYPVQVWVDPVEAVYRYVSKPITNLVDKMYDVGAWINYTVKMKDFEIKPDGQDMEIITTIRTDLSIDYKQPVTPIPFGPKLKLKGVLTCGIENKCTFKINVSLNPDLSLKITLKDDGTEIDFTKICNSELAVKGLNIYQYINPQYLASKEVLKRVLESSINKAINKAISEAGEINIVKDAVHENLARMQQVFPVAHKTWFQPNPLSGFISQPYINASGLNINVGLTAKPQLILAQTAPAIAIQQLPVRVANEKPGVHLRIGGYATYQYMADTMEALLASYLKTLDFKIPVTTGNVEIYPGNKKIVVGVEIKKNKKNGRKLGTIYLWGEPAYDAVKEEFYFKDLDFTLESKNIVLKVLSEAASKHAVKYLQDNSRFKVDKELNALRKEFAEGKKEIDEGTVHYKLKDVVISGVALIQDRLAVYVDLSGELRFNFVYKPEIITSAMEAVPDSFGTRANARPPLMQKTEGIKNMLDWNPSIKLPLYEPGDTIWYENKEGALTYRLAEIKDKRYAGDTLILMNKNGELTYRILTKEDLEKK
ncbi:MAG: DUF4403 family protein [Chitinophagaceae bacterium]|nr:DUF4403 family protein [Chitinophagaceae bacterium]